jgi:hypothetical protein
MRAMAILRWSWPRCGCAGERRQLVTAYARRAAIDERLLWRQVQRWRPWVLLLMAGWYERAGSRPATGNLSRWQMKHGVS